MEPWERTNELRTRIQERLAQATPTLIWFAGQFTGGHGIPLNTWHRVDRPLGRRASSHGPAFDVWHAMLRAERALRNTYPEDAERLRRAAKTLRDALETVTTKISNALKDVSSEKTYAEVRRLTSDDIFGTFNGLTAASVLRSEIFPERSPATPSYLAGHIIVAELKVAREQARSSGVMAIRERQPRLAVVAECVHSLTLYEEHVRSRAELFRALAQDINQINELYALAGNDDKAKEALGGYLRVVMLRMAVCAADCSALVLVTKTFFDTLSTALRKASARDKSPSLDDLNAAVSSSVTIVDLRKFKKQETLKKDAEEFCQRLGLAIRKVHDSLHLLLNAQRWQNGRASLVDSLRSLRTALRTLRQIHTGAASPDAPSIADAARFQFARMLVDTLLDNDELASSTEKRGELQFLRQTFLGETGPAGSALSPFEMASAFLRDLGKSAIGKSIDLWWANYADCYQAEPSTTSPLSGGGENKQGRGHSTPSWIDLRHSCFLKIKEFASEVKKVKDSASLGRVLSKSAAELDGVANETHRNVRDLTDWCFARRHELLQTRRLDPHELAAGLWLADRLGEPWHERYEAEALEEIRKLQRADGSFPATAPLFHSRGFVFQVPSASTISILARFVSGGISPPRSRGARTRLANWKPVLEEGARFLIDGIVGQQRGPKSSALRLYGWHSDRHPESDRIDCYTTTEAVTALCRLDDALKWLVNLEAMDGLRVSWPEPTLRMALPTDCRLEIGKPSHERAQMVTVSEFVQHQRSMNALYAKDFSSWGKGADTHVFMLYGPPGTGKTHFQSLVAGELGWPVLTLTIADFLFEGEDRVARRADELFKRLAFLSSVGIVFDEFDDMVTRREPIERGSGFRPLTSAMLPLLAELREHARKHGCLVSCTTNFIENIDGAAKRVGRVDKKLLIVYPDFQFRLLLGMVMTLERSKREKSIPGQVLKRPLMRELKKAAAVTGLCTFPDIKDYVKRVVSGESDYGSVPLPAINADYYSVEEAGTGLDTEVARSVKEMRASIGDAATFKEWLRAHDDWRQVFDRSEKTNRRTKGGPSRQKPLRRTSRGSATQRQYSARLAMKRARR